MKTNLQLSILAATAFVSLGAVVNAQQIQQAPDTTFFVTSEGPGKGGDLGGLAGADAHCQALAGRIGAGSKTWHAYL
ncbi:MAG TPA: lectin, partial [Xanthobacteraceae bacterium]|nr:lectin [Xanthobacteraceae bacterium]